MAESSLSDFLPLINQQIIASERLNTCLSKTEALVAMGMISHFPELSEGTLYRYFWVLSDFLKEALKLNEEALNLLTKMASN